MNTNLSREELLNKSYDSDHNSLSNINTDRLVIERKKMEIILQENLKKNYQSHYISIPQKISNQQTNQPNSLRQKSYSVDRYEQYHNTDELDQSHQIRMPMNYSTDISPRRQIRYNNGNNDLNNSISNMSAKTESNIKNMPVVHFDSAPKPNEFS